MKLGMITTCALGVTIALTLGGAPASAQSTGRDTTARTDTAGVNGSTSGTTTARQGRRARRTRNNMNGMNNGSSSMNMSGSDSANMNMSSNTMNDTTGTRHHTRTHRRHLASRKATSSTRISTTKETSKGEVVDTTTQAPPPPPPAPTPAPTPAPVDTTPAPPPPAPTPAPVDTTSTTANALPPVNVPHIGSFYWGIGGGASMPQSNLKNGFNTGWNVTVPFGFDPAGSPIGIRADLDYDRLMGRSDVGVAGDAAVWSANADLKLRAPFSSMLSLLDHLYFVGGVGASRIVGYGSNNSTTATTTGTYGTTTTTTTYNGYNGAYPNGQFASSFGNAKTQFGWNAGGGFSFGWGRSALFIESRYFSVNTNSDMGAETHFVPVIVGLTFR